jgi:hypothetical protein
MKGCHSPSSRASSVAIGSLGLVQVLWTALHRSGHPYAAVVVGFAAVASIGAAVKMWRDNCFESRLFASVIAGVTVLFELLFTLLGAPGSDSARWTLTSSALLVVATAVLLGLVVEARVRPEAQAERPPYAL